MFADLRNRVIIKTFILRINIINAPHKNFDNDLF